MNGKHSYQFRPDVYSRNPAGGVFYHGLESQAVHDLNRLGINTDGQDRQPLADYSGSFTPNSVHVYHRNLSDALIGHIHDAHTVLGCVAWLTHADILNALSLVEGGVQIVVQKEDFLRPDTEHDYDRARPLNKSLRAKYDALPSVGEQYHLPGIARHLNVCCILNIQPVRCLGNHNRDRRPAHPRMHNKFLVFCRAGHNPDEPTRVPYAVWTGSFNMTQNATNSFENAVYIECPQVAEAYANEWAQIFALSEPLDWESDWCAPEFRIGT